MGATTIRFGDDAMDDVAELRLTPGVATYYSAKSPQRGETPNQDQGAVVRLDRGAAVLVVADGVGGQPRGADASRLAVDALVEAVGDAAPESLRSAILDGFEAANAAVRGLGVGAATTLAVVEMVGGLMRPYHAGDSMILLVGQRGRIKLETIAHSPVGYGLEAGLLDPAEAMAHQDRHVVSNLLGADDMRIDVGPPTRVAPRDTVLLASDGLSDNLRAEEIATLVRTGPPARAAAALAARCRERMRHPDPAHPSKPDDLTFILYRPRS